MLRLKLTLGLLATLIILLLVGIYGVWLFNDLGRAVDDVLRDNYDSIKVCHYMRTATARVNTFYIRGERPYPPFDQPQTLDEVEQSLRPGSRHSNGTQRPRKTKTSSENSGMLVLNTSKFTVKCLSISKREASAIRASVR